MSVSIMPVSNTSGSNTSISNRPVSSNMALAPTRQSPTTLSSMLPKIVQKSRFTSPNHLMSKYST
ncbi:unnamed protein product, partial [Sphenostylis stenocarpa]